MLTLPSSNSGWIWRRLRLRMSPRKGPRLGVVFGDPVNVGDRALAEALAQTLPTCQLEPYLFPAKENRLGRLGLSGRHLLDGVVVGGGTLLNDMAIGPVRIAREQGLPVWIMGTGAGRGSYQVPQEPDLSRWVPLLRQCEAVTVRGPISVARLQAVGFGAATVLGDPALAFTLNHFPPPGDPRVVGLNVIPENPTPQAGDWGWEHLAGLVATVRRLHQSGCRFRSFAMLPHDQAATTRLLTEAGVPAGTVLLPADHRELQSYLAGSGLVLSLRLHGAILATAAGLPTVQIGYMDKGLDFAASVGMERQLVPINQAGEEALWQAIESVRAAGETGRRQIWENAIAARQRIHALGEAIVKQAHPRKHHAS